LALELAAIAAVGMRLSTLWFAIALGLVAISILEFAKRKAGARPGAPLESKAAAPTGS
jgi:hypothetical protein